MPMSSNRAGMSGPIQVMVFKFIALCAVKTSFEGTSQACHSAEAAWKQLKRHWCPEAAERAGAAEFTNELMVRAIHMRSTLFSPLYFSILSPHWLRSMYHITLSFLLLPVSVFLLRSCINLMTWTSFPASVSVSSLLFCGGSGDSEADGGTGFLTLCS